MKKMVIYSLAGTYYVTSEENYNARIANARAIHKMQDFNSAEEIIEYYCKYFGYTPEHFIIRGRKDIILTKESHRELSVAVVRTAMKDYFASSKAKQRAIRKELRSEWDDFLTDGLSISVADQLEKRPEEIKKRFLKANEEYEKEELECQNTVKQQAV